LDLEYCCGRFPTPSSLPAAAGTNLFITNDDHLSKKVVPGIDFIVPLSKVFL